MTSTLQTDLVQKGTILRQSHQEGAASVVVAEVVAPVGTVISEGDTIHVATLAPWTALSYVRVVMPGMDDGADSGAAGSLGFATDWTGLGDDVDGYIASVVDGAISEGSDSGTRGTVFPGTGPTGLKVIYSEDLLHVVFTATNSTDSDPSTEGYSTLRFFLEYARVDLEGGPYDKNYQAAAIVLPPEVPVITYDYNGVATGS